MPLADLSQVTLSLQRLLELAIDPQPTVTTSPPESVEDGNVNVLNVYCYHVTEDPNNRFRAVESTPRAIATSPLTVEMHYIVTAHTMANSAFDTLSAQNLLGRAMKTLHDFPVLDDTTVVGADRILPQEIQGQGNRLEVALVPMEAPDSLLYWGNEDNITARPAGYYTVRPVEIQPEPPTVVPGVVLSVGAFVAVKDTPTIGATESVLPYTLPSELGGGQATLTAVPAKVGPITPDATNVMTVRGSALSKGVSQTMLLSHPHWNLRFADLPRIPVDVAANAANGWSLTLTDDGATVEVGEDLQFDRPDGTTETVAMYPGTYLLTWEVQELFTRPGSQQLVAKRSNAAPFSVNPRITGSVRAGNGDVTLDFGGTWLLNRGRPVIGDAMEEPELDILVSVDGVALTLVTPPDPLTEPGTFVIADHALTYRPLPAADQPGLHAVTVVVEGAESQPFWIEIP